MSRDQLELFSLSKEEINIIIGSPGFAPLDNGDETVANKSKIGDLWV